MTHTLIYIGDDFYMASGTAMSSLYSEDGVRWDWGFVKSALRLGESVSIRPATDAERAPYEAELKRLEAQRDGH